MNKGKNSQGSSEDFETTREDQLEDGRDTEVVEPRPEPDPSARDEFHQAYTKLLQATDKDVEDYSRALDSVSYPVSDRVSCSPITVS